MIFQKWGISIFFMLFLISKGYTQDAETKVMIQQVDSLQRIMLKDSLQITDFEVDKMYAVRNRLKEKIAHINSNQRLSADEMKKAKRKARTQAAEELEKLLGKKRYKMYRQMISNRMQKSKSGYRQYQE